MNATLPETLTDDALVAVALVAVARALAHPARLEILRTLAGRGTCLCGQIVDVLPLAQSTVSQHLRVLREAGLVCGETQGPRTCYCLDAAAIARARAAFDALFDGLDPADSCCGTV